ncbi:RING finger protein [Aspergillus clavatus NRRL 1]|uniref:RING finger protein n=1 Tax=Aspergillus clavatus (strain ATCC 1007 / CBS 513.65 / DSM 816 / NCTC 3887 / NRRL 1 / QM 1276 / 107) TaxID=344612 RepID=A1C6D2_ASPCL|nr:RING finger protein [Aspergillus clavatus NRRL 1]EAW13953.1 RING finger protein [Aspergillus clavatus NRRL 1]
MGQSSSTQRDQRHTFASNHSTYPRSDRNRRNINEDMNHRLNPEQADNAAPSSGLSDVHNNQNFQSSQLDPTLESWQPSSPLATAQPNYTQPMESIHEEDGSQYESGEREYRSAVFARMAARRQSTMSRLGSRILPNSVIRGLLNSEEETPAEGHAHRHGIPFVSRPIPRSEVAHSSSRFSPFSSLSSRGIRRRSLRGPYFIPRSDPSLVSEGTTSSAYLDSSSEQTAQPARASWRRSVRLSRVRNSLSGPITHIFGQPSGSPSGADYGLAHQPEAGEGFSDDSELRLPPLRAMDTSMDFDETHELDSVEPAVGGSRPTSPLFSQSAQGSPASRRLPGLLRARPSRVLRREEQTPLSRVLQLAAAAIAAQLSGASGPVLPNIQSLGNDGLDGSLENFVQSLQHATSAQSAPNDAATTPADNEPPAPVNFLRVFRFANSDNARPPASSSRSTGEPDSVGSNEGGMDVDNSPGSSGEPEGRTVTLVVVGVRSVPSGGASFGDQQSNAGPGLDALLRLPFLTPGAPSRGSDTGLGLPRAENRPRVPSTRQPIAAPTNSVNNESGLRAPSRRFSDVGSRVPFSSSLPSALSESPPGPHPPPSTPAEPGLSAVSSGASTPSRRLSSSSAIPSNHLPHVNEHAPMQPSGEPSEDRVPFQPLHQRRRSDSEYARHRELGSGAVRRNGVVEPDTPAPPAGRSWLIYVVGTNLSENHPAFATPSLFTDNPTYEDMILLSSLLGPAKPPVATQDDINSAGGLYRLVEYAGTLVAEALDGAGAIQIPDGDRCLICLSDYEVAEEVRQLTKCKHVYHRDCIDQWLTTGRNSCPLCRGEGVAEMSSDTPPVPGPQDTTAA